MGLRFGQTAQVMPLRRSTKRSHPPVPTKSPQPGAFHRRRTMYHDLFHKEVLNGIEEV
jgi:hypothetical protein